MKPSEIFNALDLTMKIRENGKIFNPLFVGPPGVGKSQIVQQWAKSKNIPFIDIRAAYLEAPDLIGFPTVTTVKNRQVTVHNVPEFLPNEGKGVLLLEEPNRGTTSVMNTFMQLLTDRKIHNYSLPEGWIIVGCINPEGADYDVQAMDPALKNRFTRFNVGYDRKTFVDYMRTNNWEKDVRLFVESNTWTYKSPEEMGEAPGVQYISPRTFSSLNAVLEAGVPKTEEMEILLYQAILGNNVGRDFYNFKHNETPVLFSDLVEKSTRKHALARLKAFSEPQNFKGGMIGITVQDIIQEGTIEDDLLIEVLHVLPVDQGVSVARDLEFKRKDNTILSRIMKADPKIKEMFKDTLKPVSKK